MLELGRDDCNKWFSCASYNFHHNLISKPQKTAPSSWPFPRHNSCHQIIMINNITTDFYSCSTLDLLKRSVWELSPSGILFSNVSLLLCVWTSLGHTQFAQETFSQIRRIVPNLDYYVALPLGHVSLLLYYHFWLYLAPFLQLFLTTRLM